MSFEVIGITKDQRSGTHVIYCQASLEKYLDIVGEDFGEFSLQRKRESHKAYKRLREDIVEGALLPSITLSVKHHLVDDIIKNINDTKALTDLLSRDDVVDILDGLQRTYIISDLKRNGVTFKPGQKLLLEYWLEPNLSKLIYRMIVLNSGQKAMSMRHQIELLFLSLQETISSRLEGIEIIKEKDSKRRTQVKKYHLSSIVASYNAFITASHEADKENLVAQKLIDDGAFDSSENELTAQFEDYMYYLSLFINLDEKCWSIYTENQLDENGEVINLGDSQNWLGSENVMVSIFSAIAQFLKNEKKARVDQAFEKLLHRIETGDQDSFRIECIQSG
ncbi:hypothetical protein ACSPAH_12450 [Buttiauxella agrestis]